MDRSAFLVDLARTAERTGLAVEQLHTEYGHDQLEMSLAPADPVATADAVVLAAGSYSPEIARPLGIHLPIYPAKGYSVTMPVKDAAMAHQVSLTDDEYKLVFSRLGDRLRDLRVGLCVEPLRHLGGVVLRLRQVLLDR